MAYLVMTTTDKKQEAEKIAQTLVGEKIAACVQILGPVSSIYRWEQKVTQSEEFLLFIKTRKDLYSMVEKRIRELHSYKVPEITGFPVEKGLGDYLRWVEAETR